MMMMYKDVQDQVCLSTKPSSLDTIICNAERFKNEFTSAHITIRLKVNLSGYATHWTQKEIGIECSDHRRPKLRVSREREIINYWWVNVL